MRTFKYMEHDYITSHEVIATENDIRRTYFPYWLSVKQKMEDQDLSFEACIRDWVSLNNAQEIFDEDSLGN